MDTASKRRPGVRRPAVLAWMRLARVAHKIDTTSERFFRSEGLNTAQFDVIARLGAAREMTQQELADALLVTKGNISQLISRMEQDGVVLRQQYGRANILSLTPRGQALYTTLVPRQEALIADLFASLSEDEQRSLWRLLRKLDQTLT